MKTMITLATLIGLATVPSAALAQRVPAASIVVVETDRIYRECTACRTAQTQLQTRVTALQTRQQTLTNELRPEGQAIQAAIQALNGKEPDAALRTRAQAFQTRQEQANQELSRGQQNIQSIQANVVQQINARMNPVISQVMTARGANLAVDVGSTLAHAPVINVTAEVLAGLNRALPSVSLTPLPTQPQQQQQPQGR
ncbi:MAG TPA: OmpH family outer membrane protein [Sphingomicrobium sp.]|nr:OmpH family outer membrane protein [Sphingomicrobium sp.]